MKLRNDLAGLLLKRRQTDRRLGVPEVNKHDMPGLILLELGPPQNPVLQRGRGGLVHQFEHLDLGQPGRVEHRGAFLLGEPAGDREHEGLLVHLVGVDGLFDVLEHHAHDLDGVVLLPDGFAALADFELGLDGGGRLL